MYYKQISEGYEDQDRFNILMKVGMTKKEVKQTINSQVLTVFFMPLIMAGIHLAFAFPMIQKILMLMSGVEAKVFVIVTIGCYLVFALFYVLVYVVTSKSYYTIISSKAKNSKKINENFYSYPGNNVILEYINTAIRREEWHI